MGFIIGLALLLIVSLIVNFVQACQLSYESMCNAELSRKAADAIATLTAIKARTTAIDRHLASMLQMQAHYTD